MSSFFEYVGQCMPQLTLGLKLTLQMTVFSLILAVVVGMVMCLFSISKVKPLNWISGIYLSLIRGTPLMVQAFFIYFGIAGALHIRITSFSAAILVLCLNAGAYLSEIFRSGIAAVNKGQMEAARSLGLPYGVAMRKIILPQAIRIVIPSVLNQFIITLKDTSILSVIGCGELMRQGQLIVSSNYQSFQTYAIVAVMYYVVVIVLTKAFQLVERRLSNK
nr:amino acid ABC transporter permease [uncultured Anaerotignum sp.]